MRLLAGLCCRQQRSFFQIIQQIPAIRLPDTFAYSVDIVERNGMNHEKGHCLSPNGSSKGFTAQDYGIDIFHTV